MVKEIHPHMTEPSLTFDSPMPNSPVRYWSRHKPHPVNTADKSHEAHEPSKMGTADWKVLENGTELIIT